MMSSDDASCSDCRLELIEKKWTQLLLNWLNKCVNPITQVSKLDVASMSEIITKYRTDISTDEIDYALLGGGDIEQFIRYKYPMLRLRYLIEAKDYPKKMYIMHSMLLFHCCTSSQAGSVDHDICTKMDKHEQELILKFCENLSDMETTINNVDLSIKQAFDRNYGITKRCTEHTQQHGDTMKKVNDYYTESDSSPETDVKAKPPVKNHTIKFKSSVTVLPWCVAESSSHSKSDLSDGAGATTCDNSNDKNQEVAKDENVKEVSKQDNTSKSEKKALKESVAAGYGKNLTEENCIELEDCKSGCACVRCSSSGPCCGKPGSSAAFNVLNTQLEFYKKFQEKFKIRKRGNWRRNRCIYLSVLSFIAFAVILVIVLPFVMLHDEKTPKYRRRFMAEEMSTLFSNAFQCEKGFCQKVHQPSSSNTYFSSLSRCSLICAGPQLWPHPIGYTNFNKKLVALSSKNLEYRFQSIPSESVHRSLAEAFKLFIGDLAKLEKNGEADYNMTDMSVKKMNIVIDVESDPDPRLRQNTDESYTVKVESYLGQVHIRISSASFAGVRHGLETLSQMILLDQSTGYLITLTKSIVKDAPSYKYRGLMIDTARNYIPVADLMRTVDIMATVKLNTFHWRISDATSFPLFLPEVPQLFEYGAYDRSMIYTKQDIASIVRRAGIRGIRVLIEVAVPGPVGRAWEWSPDTSCSKKSHNMSCDNILCLRLKMKKSIFDVLETIYRQIIDLTQVDDVFHLSDGLFSMTNCFNLIDDREGFLGKALLRLESANKGKLPALPIVWYSRHLKDRDAMIWDNKGVQMNEWVQDPGVQPLGNYRVIHSSRWDLSCQMQKRRCTKYRTWQEMYAWKSWKNVEVFSIEGGEATLWTDLVDSGNLDFHLWPRLCAVAERLWSDMATNASANGYTYARLDAHRWRILMRGVTVQPVWPVYCSLHPVACVNKLKT